MGNRGFYMYKKCGKFIVVIIEVHNPVKRSRDFRKNIKSRTKKNGGIPNYRFRKGHKANDMQVALFVTTFCILAVQE